MGSEVFRHSSALYTKRDVIENIEKVIACLLPHENVAKALKRLKPKSKLKNKKQQTVMKESKYGFDSQEKKANDAMATDDKSSEQTPEEAANARELQTISDLANKIAGSGYYSAFGIRNLFFAVIFGSTSFRPLSVRGVQR